MTAPLIRDHVWRPPSWGGYTPWTVLSARPCQYMSCRRPIVEHERAVVGRRPR